MKSYIQGLITGGVLVFTMFVLMGANEYQSTGTYMTFNDNMILDTESGIVYQMTTLLANDPTDRSQFWLRLGTSVIESNEMIMKEINEHGSVSHEPFRW